MAIKDRFKKGCIRRHPTGYKLDKISEMHPVVYGADCLYKNKKGSRCDDIVICDLGAPTRPGIYLIEKKSKNPKTVFIEQLQSCAKFVEKKLGPNEKFNFMPVLVSDGLAKPTFMKMKDKKISIHGSKRKIEHIKINAPLKKISL